MELKGIRVMLLEGFARQTMPMMEALHKLGCHVTTYNSSRLDMGYLSRYPDRKLLGKWDRSDEAYSYAALLEELQREKYDVVIPMTDFSAAILSKYKQELLQYTHPAVADWDIFQNAMDKQKTMEICMAYGIPCPRTLEQVTDFRQVEAAGLSYPVAVKPRVGYGAIGFRKVESPEELEALFSNIGCQGMLVQEYIPQSGVQYQCEAFVDEEGRVKSAVVLAKTRWYPVTGGSTCCGVTVERPDIGENCIRLLQAMQWRGCADIDLIEDPRDHSVRIMELNPRVTAGVKICFDAGVDMARQIVELAMGMPVTEYASYTVDRVVRYLHADLIWFLKSKNRFHAQPSWFRLRRTTDMIITLKDPLPCIGFTISGLMKFRSEMEKRKG